MPYLYTSDNRKQIFQTLTDYPDRTWSCPSVEEATKLPHATTFRTLKELVGLGVLKTSRLSRKTLIFELAKGPLVQTTKNMLQAENEALITMAKEFAGEIASKKVISCVVYGSVAEGRATAQSDIDVLVLVKQKDKTAEREMFDAAARLSTDFNKTISPLIMTEKEFKSALSKNEPLALNIIEKNVVIYGKKPS